MFEVSPEVDAAVRLIIVLFKLLFCVIILYLLWESRSVRTDGADGPYLRPLPPRQPKADVPKVEPPKKKLFLSWAAVHRAVKTGSVTEEALNDCLFCTSVAELNLAEEYDREWFERLHPAFIKAAKEGRLNCSNDEERYNETPYWMVNLLLKRNGYGPLSAADLSTTLEQIPIHACVPSVSDGSLEVLWAAHPLRGNWRTCWGQNRAAVDAVFDEIAGDGEPVEGEDQDQDQDQDPADYWKKGRPEDQA
jgi:hypothetical protein